MEQLPQDLKSYLGAVMPALRGVSKNYQPDVGSYRWLLHEVDPQWQTRAPELLLIKLLTSSFASVRVHAYLTLRTSTSAPLQLCDPLLFTTLVDRQDLISYQLLRPYFDTKVTNVVVDTCRSKRLCHVVAGDTDSSAEHEETKRNWANCNMGLWLTTYVPQAKVNRTAFQLAIRRYYLRVSASTIAAVRLPEYDLILLTRTAETRAEKLAIAEFCLKMQSLVYFQYCCRLWPNDVTGDTFDYKMYPLLAHPFFQTYPF